MAIDTRQTLTPEAITQLQDLIQVNIDSRDGFRHAAEAVNDLTLRDIFDQLAEDRNEQADELAGFVAWSGQSPRLEGSMSAAMHRAWMSIRDALSPVDRYAVLCEAERGEDTIREAYENSMASTGGTAVYDVLLRHYAAINSTHEQVRELRDSCAGQ